MQKLKRSINMGFRVTAEEQEQIMGRMKEIGFPSLRSYLLKMALNGISRFDFNVALYRSTSVPVVSLYPTAHIVSM
jgi:hypothetical protein